MPLRGFNPLKNAIADGIERSRRTTQEIRQGRMQVPPTMSAAGKSAERNQAALKAYFEKRQAINGQNQG